MLACFRCMKIFKHFTHPPLPCGNKWGGGGCGVLGLRRINTCRKVPLQVNFFKDDNILHCLLCVLSIYRVTLTQGVTRRCRLSCLTNSTPRFMSPNAGRGAVAGSQPIGTALHITWHGAQINFGDLTPYLTYALTWSRYQTCWFWTYSLWG